MADSLVTGYVPGTWVAMTGPRAWLLADIAPDGPVIDRCWPLIRHGAGLAEVAEALLSDGLRSVDGFALAYHVGGEWQLIVRGGAVAAAGTEQVTAAGVATWVERRFTVADQIRLTGAGAASGPRLPLLAGVVLADEVTVGTGDALPEPPEPPDVPAAEAAPPPIPETHVVQAEAEPEPQQVNEHTESLAHLRAGFAATEPLSFDHLFGATQRPPEPRPAPAPVLWPSTAQPPTAQPSTAQPSTAPPLAAGGLIDSVPWAQPASEPDIAQTVNRSALPGAAATVHAVACAQRHLNPPHVSVCRTCGGPVDGQAPTLMPRPPLGVLQLSTGDLITLDRGVLMGRAPTLADGADSDRPHVVRLASPSGDISRNHVQVRLADWTVLVTDLGSTNGTTVTVPGKPPQRLRPHEPVAIEPGTVVSLADEITFRFGVT